MLVRFEELTDDQWNLLVPSGNDLLIAVLIESEWYRIVEVNDWLPISEFVPSHHAQEASIDEY